MKSNLKIVAAAVALGFGATAAYAGTATVTTAAVGPYSREALALVGGNVVLPAITITLANNYTYQDDMLITITGGATVKDGTYNVICVPIIAGNPTTVGFVERVGNTLNFRITDQDGANIGDACTFSGIVVDAASLANAGTLSVSYQGKRFVTGQVIDSGALAANAALGVVSQFKLTVSKPFDAVIDVEADRKLFVDDANGATADNTLNDELLFTMDTLNGGPVYQPLSLAAIPPTKVDSTAATFVITGNFSFGADANGDCDAYFGNVANLVLGGGLAFIAGSSDCTKLTLTETAALGTESYGVIVKIPGNKVISPTDFTGTASVAYQLDTDATKKGTFSANWDPGAWTINGALIEIAYMPYGDNISQIIYVANKGPADAEMTVDYFTDTGASGTFVLTTKAAKGKVTAIAGEIKDKLAAAGFTAGKAFLRLTMPVSDRYVEAYSAYNVGGSDRGNVVNNSNGRSFFFGTGVTF